MENGWERGVVVAAILKYKHWDVFVLPEGRRDTLYASSDYFLDVPRVRDLRLRTGMSVVFKLEQRKTRANPIRLAGEEEVPFYRLPEERGAGFRLRRGTICDLSESCFTGFVRPAGHGRDVWIHGGDYRVREDLGDGQVRWLQGTKKPELTLGMEIVFLSYFTRKGLRVAVWYTE